MSEAPARYTAFSRHRRLAAGGLREVALAVKAAADEGAEAILVFDDASGQPVELDLRGSQADVEARLSAEPAPPAPTRGRPKLGVTAREVTLLPSHWEWLAAQPGGASAALRRLVDQARRSGADQRRRALETLHRVMFALAGDLPGFEDATRAVYAGDGAAFERLIAAWPSDVAGYVGALSRSLFDPR